MVDRLFILKENGKKQDTSINPEKLFDHPQILSESHVEVKSVSNEAQEDPLSIDNQIDKNISTLETNKKKKHRRILEQTNNDEEKKSVVKKSSWYKKVNLTKPIVYVALLFLFYFMWIKRDIWMTRLLTSNNRIQRTAFVSEQNFNEKIDSSEDLSSSSSNQMEKTDMNDHQQSSLDDSTAPVKKSSSAKKVNIRAGRVKVSFSKERRKHKHHQSVGDDEDEDVEDKIIDEEKPDLTLSKIHHRHHRSSEDRRKTKDVNIISANENIIEQLEKLVKSQGQHEDFLKILRKETRLSKSKLTQLIEKQDYNLLTLDVFISLLNSFHLTLLILPK